MFLDNYYFNKSFFILDFKSNSIFVYYSTSSNTNLKSGLIKDITIF